MPKLFVLTTVALLSASNAHAVTFSLSQSVYSRDPAASNYIGNATENVVDWKDISEGNVTGADLGLFFTSLGDQSKAGYFVRNTVLDDNNSYGPGGTQVSEGSFLGPDYTLEISQWVISPTNSLYNGEAFTSYQWYDTGWRPTPEISHAWVQGEYFVGHALGDRKALIYGNPIFPEPSTLLLALLGLAMLPRRRRR